MRKGFVILAPLSGTALASRQAPIRGSSVLAGSGSY